MNIDKVKDAAAKQAASFGIGAAFGALTKHAANQPKGPHRSLALQIGSAVGAAAVGGAGLTGSVAAGTAVITAQVAAVTTATTAAVTVAAPFVAAAAVGYGIYWLWKKL